jgi:Asp-tRNA(Asn)/Glu-tRNA(Gln) amidotransferase A subunit family amidase
MLRNTRPFNVLGVPAISIPCGQTSDGFPIGIQLAAAPGRDDVVLAAAKSVEKIVNV